GWLQGHTLETLAGADGGLSPELRAVADQLPPLDDAVIERLDRIEGLGVHRLVADYDLLTVNLSHVPDDQLANALAALAPHAGHVLELAFEGRAAVATARAAIRE